MKLPSLSSLAGYGWVKPVLVGLAAVLLVLMASSFWTSIKHKLFGDPAVTQARTEAIGQAARAEGVSQAAQGSMEVVVRVQQERAAIDTLTQRNDYAIKQATGSGDQAPGVGAALDRALCLRDAYRGQPDCLALQGAGGGERAP